MSVVIPARDAALTLPATLADLEQQEFSGEFEVIVVNDASTDATGAIAAGSSVVSRVIEGGGDGPARARNAGAAAARAPLLAFLDADCRPTRGWLAAGTTALRSADLVLGQVEPDPARERGPFDRTIWVTGVSPLHESANMFIRRDAFERLGGFESWIRPRNGVEMGEDVLFGWRARRAGMRLDAAADALAYHEVFRRGVRGFVAERSRLRFFPVMVKRIPELRTAFCYRRVFLTKRSAAFDAAAAGAALAIARRSPAPLLVTAPYVRMLSRDARNGGVARGLTVAGANVAADFVGALALLYGSLRSGALLI